MRRDGVASVQRWSIRTAGVTDRRSRKPARFARLPVRYRLRNTILWNRLPVSRVSFILVSSLILRSSRSSQSIHNSIYGINKAIRFYILSCAWQAKTIAQKRRGDSPHNMIIQHVKAGTKVYSAFTNVGWNIFVDGHRYCYQIFMD